MTLVNLNQILIPVQKEKYAVRAFNVTNMEMVISIANAAETMEAPVIIQYAEGDDARILIEQMGYFAKEVAREASVPIVLHLDHGTSFEGCMRAIRSGYSSVMFELSSPLIEIFNIRSAIFPTPRKKECVCNRYHI